MLGALAIPQAANQTAVPVLIPRRPFGMFAATPFRLSASETPQRSPMAVAPAAATSGAASVGGNTAAAPPSVPLGGSMRQPFDYGAARDSLLPPEQPHSKTHNTLVGLASLVGPALMAASGNQAGANIAMENFARRRQAAAQQQFDTAKLLNEWQHQDWSRQNQAPQASCLMRTGYGASWKMPEDEPSPILV